MTYCVGLKTQHGLVFMSDTRTNAGVDNISTFRKMHCWQEPDERVLVLLSAGNLATTQAVVSLLDERTKAPDERTPSMLETPSMYSGGAPGGGYRQGSHPSVRAGRARAQTHSVPLLFWVARFAAWNRVSS